MIKDVFVGSTVCYVDDSKLLPFVASGDIQAIQIDYVIVGGTKILIKDLFLYHKDKACVDKMLKIIKERVQSLILLGKIILEDVE